MAVQTSARLRYVSIPPRKMRLVARLVKGLPIQKALDILNFTPRVAAHHIAKTLKSAAANALSIEGTAHLKPEDLMVKNIYVDAAPMVKRIRFQSMGRVFRYRKRNSHLTIILEEKAHPKPKSVETAKAKTSAAEGDATAAAVSQPKVKVEKKKSAVKAASKGKKAPTKAKKVK